MILPDAGEVSNELNTDRRDNSRHFMLYREKVQEDQTTTYIFETHIYALDCQSYPISYTQRGVVVDIG
jgi:hypothetical protein